jgi:hypothetical protein
MGALTRARDRAMLDQVDKAIDQELRVNAQVAVPAQQLEHLVAHRADARLHGRAVGDPLYDMLGDAPIDVPAGPGGEFDQRVVSLAPAGQLRDVDLVLSGGAGHPLVDLHEEGNLADERRQVVGVAAQREVAVAVGGATAASTREQRVERRSRRGTSLKLFGTRSQVP